MVSVMNLTGYFVIDHGDHQSDVFIVISLHIVGMYALVLVIGEVVDRIGRHPQCEVAGLLMMGVSTLGLAWFDSGSLDLGLARSVSALAGTSRTSPPPRSSPTVPIRPSAAS